MVDLEEGLGQEETEDLEEGLDQEETEGPVADLDLEVLVALEAEEVLEDPEDWAAKDKEVLQDLEEIEDLVEGPDQEETEDLEEGLDQEETEGPEADLDLEVLVALEAGEVLEDPEDWAAKDKIRAVVEGEEGMAVLQVLVAGTVSEAVEGTQILIQGAENKAQGLAALSLLLVVLFRTGRPF